MQPTATGLFNEGANAVQYSVARGPESLGIGHVASQQIGAGYTLLFIALLTIAFWRGYKRIGTILRPSKASKGRKKRRK